MSSQAKREAVGRLSGEVVVVTGGANGIGRAVVELAVRDGAQVVALDIDQSALELMKDELSAEVCWPVAVDITDEEQVSGLFAGVGRRWGGATILVNNAGRNAAWELTEMTSDQWDEFFALDLKAAWLCAKYAVPPMKARHTGVVVNVASVHAIATAEGQFPYAAAKSGLLGLTRSMALDLGPHGIRVNAVSPGYTSTRLVDEFLAQNGGDQMRAEVEAKHALRRIGTPTEVAEVILFLASSSSSFVSGANWVVDGGLSARYA